MTHPLAGTLPEASMLIDVERLRGQYYDEKPDVDRADERVAFGTSGHRGSALAGGFNEDHILAITQAICEHRAAQGIDGPLFLGIDTHALSEAAQVSALEVLAANGVEIMIDRDRRARDVLSGRGCRATHERGRLRRCTSERVPRRPSPI